MTLPAKNTLGDVNILRDDYRTAIEAQRDQIAFLGTAWESTTQYIHPCSTRGSDGILYDSLQSSLGQDPITTSSAYWVDHTQVPADTGVYDTIAQLRASGSSPAKEYATVLGYYTPGDGGGGPDRIWKTGGSYVDNGGSVITPGGVPGPDAWVWPKRAFSTVLGYGAKGDGVTSDTSTIQAAMYDSAERGEKLVVPKTDAFYFLNGASNVNLDCPNNLVMEWEDGAWFRQQKGSQAGALFSNKEVRPFARESITFINPQIDGQDIDFLTYQDNAIGFAGGVELDTSFGYVSGVNVIGGKIKGYKTTFEVSGPGGKGIGFEEGVIDSFVRDTEIEDCTYACFVSDTTLDSDKVIRNIHFSGIKATRCAVVWFHVADGGAAPGTLPTTDPKQASVSFEGIGYNCGHYPDKPIIVANSTATEKTGPIVISGGSNGTVKAKIFNGTGFPNADNPAGGTQFPTGYPAAGTPYMGGGHTGPIGAVVWGWGRNYNVDVDYYGECDDLVRVSRAFAHGASVYSGDPKPTGSWGYNVNVRHNGQTISAIRSGLVGFPGNIASATTTTVTLPSGGSDRDGEYVGLFFTISSGTGAGQTKRVDTYDGATKTITVDTPYSTVPDATSVTAIGSTIAPVDDQLSGKITATYHNISGKPVHETARFYTGYTANFSEQNDGTVWREHRGTLKDIYDLLSISNTPPGSVMYAGESLHAQTATLNNSLYRVVTIADDNVAVLGTPVGTTNGFMFVSSVSSQTNALVWFRTAGGTQQMYKSDFGSTVVSTSDNTPVILTGTTGTDGFLNLAAGTDGKLYIENRRGADLDFSVTFIGCN